MSVSNKTLSILLLAAIVVSLGGTFISLNRLSGITPTGYATDEGTVQLTIEEVVSITTEDNPNIDFGTCLLDTGVGLLIDSEGTGNAACDNLAPGGEDPIFVRNDGTVPLVVNLETSDVGTAHTGDFLDNQSSGSEESWIAYRTLDMGNEDPNTGGCVGALGATDYENITVTTPASNSICTELDSGVIANSVGVHFQIYIPANTIEGDTLTLTFHGAKVE